MKVIGLTGGIASGKSTASEYLHSLGAHIVDADEISRACTRRGGAAFAAVCEAFAGIQGEDGEIDRRKLGGIVFSDEEARDRLNALVHPVVREEAARQIEKLRAENVKVCVLDVPLLFETGMDTLCAETWLIYVPREEQIRRLEERDGLKREEALARIRSQMPLKEKLKRADFSVDSSGTIEETREKLRRLWEERI